MTPSVYWYFTRGSGAVALLLLTASVALGIATSLRWRTRSLPRFAVAGLHRNATLLALLFVALHVVTTVVDGFAPIGWKDAVVPFLSPYRPLWLGLGAVAFDLTLALVLTSLLRARLGYRTWRATHWLAYASWPVALVHALGTGSDARRGFMEALALACVLAVAATLALRLARSAAAPGRRLAAAAGALLAALVVGAWYRGGPGAPGWAAKAGTPARLLAHPPAASARTSTASFVSLPASFTATLAGTLRESQTGDGLVDVRIDATLGGGVRGRLRLVLEGEPLDEGGVRLTGSGVAFATAGSPLYEGSIVGLDGDLVVARVAAGSAALDLRLRLRLAPDQSTVTGTVRGSAA